MGTTTTPIPFFTDDIVIGEVESASAIEFLGYKGKTIGEVIGSSRASLEESDDGTMILKFDGKFIVWKI